MSPELEKECISLINKYVRDDEKHLFYNSLSKRFISRAPKLNEEYLRKQIKIVTNHFHRNFDTPPGNFYWSLSEEFVEYFENEIDWRWVSSNTELSSTFMEKHLDKLTWINLMNRQNFSEEFLTKYIHKMGYQDWVNLLYNYHTTLSKEFILTHKDKIPKRLWEHDLIQKRL